MNNKHILCLDTQLYNTQFARQRIHILVIYQTQTSDSISVMYKTYPFIISAET